jgi:hypothetical protein
MICSIFLTPSFWCCHGVILAFKRLTPAPLQEHQDAHEFLYQLHEVIDSHGSADKPGSKPIDAAMGGSSVQIIKCRTVDYESRRTEAFNHISVDVQVHLHLFLLSSCSCDSSALVRNMFIPLPCIDVGFAADDAPVMVFPSL